MGQSLFYKWNPSWPVVNGVLLFFSPRNEKPRESPFYKGAFVSQTEVLQDLCQDEWAERSTLDYADA